MRILLFILILICPAALLAQDEADSTHLRLEGSFFSNTPSFPLSGKVFVPPYHPGIDLGVRSPFSRNEHGRWEWRASLAYYYHRLSHHGIHLRPGLGYTLESDSLEGFSWEFGLNMGYLRSIGLRDRFELNEEGEYEKVPEYGRSQFSVGLSTGPAYRPKEGSDWELFLNYRFWVQTPFVHQYVPVLPNMAFHLGVRFDLSTEELKE